MCARASRTVAGPRANQGPWPLSTTTAIEASTSQRRFLGRQVSDRALSVKDDTYAILINA